ncbi:hypothetical protein EYS14_03575 [Alteromonadaceae bacterium M269]|nr:hypothetical protein EYS14_03575 [Alteromonadaceae bacterium M269]
MEIYDHNFNAEVDVLASYVKQINDEPNDFKAELDATGNNVMVFIDRFESSYLPNINRVFVKKHDLVALREFNNFIADTVVTVSPPTKPASPVRLVVCNG